MFHGNLLEPLKAVKTLIKALYMKTIVTELCGFYET